MNWLNIRTESLHSPEFIGCNPTRRATWLSLSLWCASQENGGIVSGGATWSDRQWQQTCGVTKREATDSCSLYRVDGDSVVLWGYPSEKENEVQALREAGRLGGLARTSAKVAAARANGAKRNPSQTKAELGSEPKHEPKHEPKPNPSLNPTELEGERKENKNENKKENEKDVGENETAPPSGDAGLPLAGFDQNLATSEGRHDTSPSQATENPAAAKETANGAKPAEGQGGALPAGLETEAFRAAWADWLAYRRECKVSQYRPRALAAQLAMLAEWGPDAAVDSIRQSIRQQWRGLFEPKNNAQWRLDSGAQQRSEELAKVNGYEY